MTARITNPTLGPFKRGMNNRLPDHALYDSDERVQLLRSAVNVDVTNAGTLRRRPGYTKLAAGTDCHSLAKIGEEHFFVDGAELKLVEADRTVRTLRGGLTPGARMSFAVAPTGDVIFSNGHEMGRVYAGAAHRFSAPAAPTPTVTVAAGVMPAAAYQVSLAFVDEQGLGPAATPALVTLASPGGLLVDVPALPDGVEQAHIYLTAPNGQTLQRARTVAAAGPVLIGSVGALGARCYTQNLAELPAGRIVRSHMGRTLVAAGNTLHFTEPYSPLCVPSKGYIMLPAEITVVEPCEGGVYVVADQAYWLGGDLAEAELRVVLPYGAPFGGSGAVPNTKSVWWMSHRGLVLADKSGNAKNLQERDIDFALMEQAAGTFIERGGLKQFLVSTR